MNPFSRKRGNQSIARATGARANRGSRVYHDSDHRDPIYDSFVRESRGSQVNNNTRIVSEGYNVHSEYYDTRELYDPVEDQIVSVPIKDRSITETQGLREQGVTFEPVDLIEGRVIKVPEGSVITVDQALSHPDRVERELIKINPRKAIRYKVFTPRTLLNTSRDTWQDRQTGFTRVTSKGRKRYEVEETPDNIYDPTKDRKAPKGSR